MTILESISEIHEYLVNNDDFTFDGYVKSKTLLFDCENTRKEHEAIFNEGLKQLESGNIIKLLRISNKEKENNKWVLVKPIQMLEQSVVLPGDLASMISQTINMVSTKLDSKHQCNPLNITKDDIKYLLSIVITLLREDKND
jgi:hypothetical protein